MDTTYQYFPLDASRKEVRMVMLAPSRSFAAPISCSLVHQSLDTDATYEALSYTWGDATCERLISLNGLEFSVTKNLDAALRHLRYTQDERSIWIDAICINQKDEKEKSQQVTMMHLIYQTATKVVVWLGPASPNSDIAFTFLAQASSKQLEFEEWLPKTWEDPNRLGSWRAIYDIINRDYWRRVWILQEIFFARSVIVRCGFRCIQWLDFIFLYYNLPNSHVVTAIFQNPMEILSRCTETILMLPGILESSQIPQSIEDWRRLAEGGENPPLGMLLMAYRNLLSTNPLDKVYGVVGMSGQYNDQRALKIDYSLSKRCAYIETVRCLITRGLVERGKDFGPNVLDVICCSLPDLSDRCLPSWVPDWSTPAETQWNAELKTMSIFYNANGAYLPDVKFEINKEDGILVVHGLQIATVDHFGAVAVPFPGPLRIAFMDKTERQALMAAYSTAVKLAMSNSEHMPHSYKDQSVRRKEFARTMLCNHLMSTVENIFPALSDERLEQICEVMSFDDTNDDWESILAGNGGDSDARVLGVIGRNLRRYRFCVSSAGSFLMAPRSTRVGDRVCVLFGCDMPVVLREKEKGHYIFVGECYANGFMDGEALKDAANGKYTAVEFQIH